MGQVKHRKVTAHLLNLDRQSEAYLAVVGGLNRSWCDLLNI
jgi:hypothetical protein